MLRKIFAVLALLFFSATALAIDPIEFRDAAEERRFQTLARELRCLVCQNESLADSTAGLARDLRNDVITQMREGRSDQEIKDYMTDRYGDFILYSPPVKPRTWLLWFGPLLMLLVGAAAVAWVIRGRRPGTSAGTIEDPLKGDWQ